MFFRSIRCVTALAILVIAFSSAYSQDLDNASFAGQVTDSNGLSVVGATVIATAKETGLTRTVTTNDDGRYQILGLAPGIYVIKVSASGFADKSSQDITTIAGQRVQFDVRINPGDVRVETTVSADDEDVPMVDNTRTVVGSTLTEREIEEIPNNTRNPLDLVLTMGGTAEEALSVSDLAEDRSSNPRTTPLEQGNFTISGGASFSNNITIDGFDNNDDRSARDRFQPSLEILREVQVIRNQFSAEYGRASGGRVNLSIRGGTNRYRGRAFMFFRDDNLNANTWYNNSRGIQRLPLTEYNPGFTIGGPIRLPFYDGRNRTFFSFAYENNRLEDTTFLNTYLPVVPNPRFSLPTPTENTQFCDNASPAACVAGDAGYVSPYKVLFPTPNNNNVIVARIDHRITQNNNLRFTWQFGRRLNRRTPGTNSLTRVESALQARKINTDAFNIHDVHTFGSKTINEAGFQWSRFQPSYETDSPGASVVIIGYRNPETLSVQSLVAGNSTASTLQNFSDSRNEIRYQFKDTLTHIAGRHTIKTGFDIQRVDSRALALGDATGTFNFSSVLTYSNNQISRYRQNFGTASDVVNTYWGVFGNDEFKLRPNLTISFGLRYERETAVTDSDNFGPRLGIAWSPFRGGNGVIRFGAARVYNRVLLRTIGDFIQNRLGSLAQFDTNSIPTSTTGGTFNARTQILNAISQNFPNGFLSIDELKGVIANTQCGPISAPVSCNTNFGFLRNTGSSGNPLRSVSPDLKIPESYQFNIGFEREIKKGWVFEANYSYNKTVHLWREYNINLPVLPAGFEDYTAYLSQPGFTFLFPNANGTVRTYRFGLGTTSDGSGVATTLGGTSACSTTTNVTCWVNLNSASTSTTAPNTNAADGVSSNSIGGPIGIARAALQHLRPDPSVDEMEQVGSIGNSVYNGLVLEFRRRLMRFGNGFAGSFRMAYTLSRMMDDGLNNTTNAEVNGDFRAEWARARQDRLHRFSISGTFDTPWWFGKLRFSPVMRLGSSAPFALGYGVDRNLNDTSTDRILFSGNLKDLKWRKPGSPVPTALINQFSLQPIGSKGGNLPRNAGIGPGLFIFDISVSRQWTFKERFRLRPNLEIGNVLNKTSFSYGSEFVDAFGPNATDAVKAAFLVPTRTYRQRQIRIGMRFDF